MEISEVVELLTAQVEPLAKMLLPGGKCVGREWEAGSIAGETGRSLKLCLSGSKKGVWSDFATGEGGDLLDLWCVARGVTLATALQEAKAHLGVSDQEFVKTKDKQFRKPSPKGAQKVAPASSVMKYLTDTRKLTMETIAAYRVAEAAQIGPWEGWQRQEPWVGPWVCFPSFHGTELVAMKYLHLDRKEGKKQTLVESGCKPICFGWQAINPKAREIVIAEGEIDAMTLHQYGFPAVSVPFGAGKGDKQQWVDYDWNELERFETIYLCMDNDAEGKASVDELINRLGVHRCRIVTLPDKDANECLKAGITREDIQRCFKASTYIEPEELKKASDYTGDVVAEFYPTGGKLPGFDMPWQKIPFRFLRGEVSIITGCNGHGKSLLWGQVMLAGTLQNERCCIASFEMSPKKTLARLVRQSTGDKLPKVEDIEGCLEWLSDKIWLFALVGTGKVDKMLQVFEYAWRRHGIRHFLVDSLLKLGLNEDDYNGQKAIMERLCDWANVTGAHVHLVAHPRKEDESMPVGKMSVRGGGAITDLTFNIFSIWRNKAKEREVQDYKDTNVLPPKKSLDEMMSAPDCILTIEKSRNVEDAEGKYGLWYDSRGMIYKGSRDAPPISLYREHKRHTREQDEPNPFDD
jgi:twinkle protein